MKLKFLIWMILGLLIVAFGQPAWIPALAPISAICGFAFFWKGLCPFSSQKVRFWIATLFFTAVQSVQLSWFISFEYQGIYILFAYLGLAIFMGLQFGALTLLVSRQKMKILHLFCIASCWTLLEWVRLYFLCGFSFNPVGLTLSAYLPSMQFASVFGVLGLSFWVIFINLLCYNFLLSLESIRSFFYLLTFALIPYLFGLFHLTYHQRQNPPSQEFTIALVQTGLLPSEKVPLKNHLSDFISPWDQWKRIIRFLKEDPESKKLDLIVLPEAALPFSLDQPIFPYEKVLTIFLPELGEEEVTPYLPPLEPPYAIKREKWVVTHAFIAQLIANFFNSELIAGFDDYDKELNKNFNAAFHFSPYDTEIKRYEKRVLVPGEYLPFAWCKSLLHHYGIDDFFTPGKEAKVFKGKIPLSSSICYEETFSHLMREGRLKGAELFVNLTNDNWYPETRLPEQHFEHARLRTVENGIPLVRSTNNGVTAVVDSLGRTGAKLEKKQGALILTLNRYTYSTLYVFWGNAGILLICCSFIGIFLYKNFSKIFYSTTQEAGR